MDALLSRLPNLRVIHLMRDPRGVTLSRFNLNASVRSLYAGAINGTDIMIREAEVYCRAVADDLVVRAKLELRYPGRILGVSYDYLVTDLERYVGKIYRFLDLPQVGVRSACNAMRVKVTPGGTNGTKKISSLANNWRTALNYDVRLRILSVCKDFFDLSEFEWRV